MRKSCRLYTIFIICIVIILHTTHAQTNIFSTKVNSGVTVATISALQSYSGTAEELYVSDTLRGGNFFKYFSSGLTVNGVTVFSAAGKGSGFWQRQYNYATGIDIKWAGAKPNDITDATIPIQKAVDAAKRLHQSVFISPGTYRTTQHVNATDSMQMYGIKGLSKIHMYEQNTILNDYCIYILPPFGETWHNIRIEGITFEGVNEDITSTHVTWAGILLGARHTIADTLYNLTVTNCEFYYFKSKAINAGDSMYLNNATIQNNHFHHIGTPEMNIISDPGASGLNFPSSESITVAFNKFDHIGTQKNIDGDWALYEQHNTTNIKFIGNTIESCNGGLTFAAGTFLSGAVIVNNTGTGFTTHAIFIDADKGYSEQILIAGNEFTLNKKTVASVVTLHRSCNSAVIANNTFNVGGSGSNGVVINGSCGHISVTNNLIYNGGNRGIFLTALGDSISDVKIAGNMIKDTTFDIGIYISGTVQIKNVIVQGNSVSGLSSGIRFSNVTSSSIIDNQVLSGDIRSTTKSLNNIITGNTVSLLNKILVEGSNYTITNNNSRIVSTGSGVTSSRVENNARELTSVVPTVTNTGSKQLINLLDNAHVFNLAPASKSTYINFSPSTINLMGLGTVIILQAANANATLLQSNDSTGFFLTEGANYTMNTNEMIILTMTAQDAWYEVARSNANGWSLAGNAGTVPGVNFIGTTDEQPLMFKVNNNKAGYIDFDASAANTSFGYQTLFSNVTGNYNTANGYAALYSNTTGNSNTALGFSADVSQGNLTNATAIGYAATADANNKVRVGNAVVTSIGGQVSWSTFSDGRFKKNIKENVKGLTFINSLRPITYTIDINSLDEYYNRKRMHDSTYEKRKVNMQQFTNEAAKIVYNGFIAQEVEAVAKKLNYNFGGIDKPEAKDGLYGLRYADFVVPLVKAVQELSKQNDSLQEENNDLKKQFADLKALVLTIKQNQESCSPCNAAEISVKKYHTAITNKASLEQNVPNPFFNSTTINYTLPQKFTTAQIIIIDKNGKTLKIVNVSGAGRGKLDVDASVLAAAVYNYSLIINRKLIGTKQMELIK